MARDKKSRAMGYMTLSALGVSLGAIIDSLRAADVPNDVTHYFLNRLEDGFEGVLRGEARAIMLGLVIVLRGAVAGND